MADATCTVTLNVGFGADAPKATDVMLISRVNRGTNGDMVVTTGAQAIPMVGKPFPTVDLEQGVTYQFVERWSGGIKRTCEVPEASTADYSALTDVVPIPPSPGNLGDTIIDGVISDTESDSRATLDGLYQPLDSDLSAIAALSTTSFGRSLLTQADAAATLAALGIGNGRVLEGSGAPEGVVTASVGALYADTAKTNGAAIWRKDSGSGNTGWVVVDGDTGWRDISGMLTAGLAKSTNGGAAMVRRVGNTVYYRFRLDVSAGSISTVSAFPTGFSPNESSNQSRTGESWSAASAGAGVGELTTILGCWLGAGWRTSNLPNPGSLSWTGSMMTADAWPTSLPGTAA